MMDVHCAGAAGSSAYIGSDQLAIGRSGGSKAKGTAVDGTFSGVGTFTATGTTDNSKGGRPSTGHGGTAVVGTFIGAGTFTAAGATDNSKGGRPSTGRGGTAVVGTFIGVGTKAAEGASNFGRSARSSRRHCLTLLSQTRLLH